MIILLFGDAKFILFASFVKAYSPKNVIFATYLSNVTNALYYIF